MFIDLTGYLLADWLTVLLFLGLSLNGKSHGLQTHVYTGSYPVVPVLVESVEWLRYKQNSTEIKEKKENDY